MGSRTKQPDEREDAVKHLEEALATEDSSEKDFHVRHALQLLDVATTDE